MVGRLHPRWGLTSFAYRYAIGVDGMMPQRRMDAVTFIRRAAELGFSSVLLCENLRYADLTSSSLRDIRQAARETGVRLDVGFRTLAQIERHIELARVLEARTLRIVMGDGGELLPAAPERLVADATQALRAAVPALEEGDMRLGVENNFELPTDDLVSVVQQVDNPRVGLIMDTTNCLGLIEEPYGVLERMAPYLHAVHLKDYIVRKVEAGYRVEGVSLGEGRLDVERFLRHVQAHAPGVDLFMEYSVRRPDGMPAEEVIAFEDSLNRKNALALRRYEL